jgi:hypothetical protein
MSFDVTEFLGFTKGPGVPCWIDSTPFTDEQRAKLLYVMFERPDITATAISKVMATWGFEINEQSVRRHRSKKCCRKSG